VIIFNYDPEDFFNYKLVALLITEGSETSLHREIESALP
jgi:hypothetical protein